MKSLYQNRHENRCSMSISRRPEQNHPSCHCCAMTILTVACVGPNGLTPRRIEQLPPLKSDHHHVAMSREPSKTGPFLVCLKKPEESRYVLRIRDFPYIPILGMGFLDHQSYKKSGGVWILRETKTSNDIPNEL